MTFTYGWIESGNGEKTFQSEHLTAYIRPDIEGWILSAPKEDFTWHSTTITNLEGPFRFLVDYVNEKRQHLQKPPTHIRRLARDEIILDARRHSYGSFEIFLQKSPQPETPWKRGDIVGSYNGYINRAIGTFVLGVITISASESLDDQFRGQGLADVMRDAAEEIMGLPTVPHGRNFVHGSLSDAAAKSWSRRAASRNVHGFSNESGLMIRNKLAKQNEDFLSKRRGVNSSDLAADLAGKVGWDVEVIEADGRVIDTWAVSPEGVPVHPSGILFRDRLIQEAAGACRLNVEEIGHLEIVRFSALDAIKRLSPFGNPAQSENDDFAKSILHLYAKNRFSAAITNLNSHRAHGRIISRESETPRLR